MGRYEGCCVKMFKRERHIHWASLALHRNSEFTLTSLRGPRDSSVAVVHLESSCEAAAPFISLNILVNRAPLLTPKDGTEIKVSFTLHQEMIESQIVSTLFRWMLNEHSEIPRILFGLSIPTSPYGGEYLMSALLKYTFIFLFVTYGDIQMSETRRISNKNIHLFNKANADVSVFIEISTQFAKSTKKPFEYFLLFTERRP